MASALTDWKAASANPEAYSQDQLQSMAMAAGIGIPELQEAVRRGFATNQAKLADYKPPEIKASEDIAKIDPAAAALTSTVANAYNTQVPQAQATSPATAALNTAVVNSYNPTLAAAHAQLPGTSALSGDVLNSYNTSLGQANKELALGTHLDPAMQREIAQYVRGAQIGRGNSEGGAQTVEEAMTQGGAGLALQQQRRAYAQAVQQQGAQLAGARQSYLGAVQGQGQGLVAQQQNYLQNVLQQATGYLGSGQTKGGQATTYLNNAINQNSAALGGYPIGQNAQPPAPAYMYLDPNAGAQFAQGTQGFMNQGVGATTGSPGSTVPWGSIAGAAGSAIGGLAGSFITPGVGTVIGAGLGGLAGTAIGQGASASGVHCWVARQVFGENNPRWLQFRNWLLTRAPTWLMQFYARNGQQLAERIKNKPRIQRVIKGWMEMQLATI